MANSFESKSCTIDKLNVSSHQGVWNLVENWNSQVSTNKSPNFIIRLEVAH